MKGLWISNACRLACLAAGVVAAVTFAGAASGSTPTDEQLATFTVSAGSSHVAGTTFSASITATEGDGGVATDYTGTKCLTFSGPANSPFGMAPVYPLAGSCPSGQSSLIFQSGVATAPGIKLFKAATTTMSVKDANSISGTSA